MAELGVSPPTSLYPQPPQGGGALTPSGALDLLSGVIRNTTQMKELNARNAIGQAYQKNIQPDGTFDQPGFNAMIRDNPDAAWMAGEALPHALDIARSQTGNMLQQNQAVMSLFGSLPPNASDEQIRNTLATASRIFKGQNSAVLTAIGSDLLSKRGQSRASAIADLGAGARGPQALSERVNAGIDPVTGAPIAASSGAVTRAEQLGSGATVTGLPVSQPEDLRQMQGDQARQANYRSEILPFEKAIEASNALHARNPGQPIFGPGTEGRQNWQAFAQGIAPSVTQSLGIDPKDLADYDKARKYAVQAMQSRAAGLGVHSDTGLNTAIGGSPNVKNTDLAFDELLRVGAAVRRAEYAQHQNSADRAGPTGTGYPGLKASWASQNDIRAFSLQDMTPEQQDKLLSSLKKGSPEWKRFNHSLHEGSKAGVIDIPSPAAPVKSDKRSEAAPPIPGARLAADGQWYVRQPHANGDYQRVVTG